MFDGHTRRIVSMWFPRLASDRALRIYPVDGPFALIVKQNNAERIHCLNEVAGKSGLWCGMPLADARASCPDLRTRPADLHGDQRFLMTLRRWAMRYCPWAGLDENGLVLDVTGVAHLFGGEAEMLADMRARLGRAGLTVRLGLADTRGAAWALAHYDEGMAPAGAIPEAVGPLPVAALRLDEATVNALQRLGLRRIADLAETPRAPLARRFGPEVLMRLDQAFGALPEPVSAPTEAPHYGVRLTLPEPIGLADDVMAGLERLLTALCGKLQARDVGARSMCLTMRRVDGNSQQVEIRFARPMRQPARILPLFERGIAQVDAGFGIDQLRLEAVQVETLPSEQNSLAAERDKGALDDLVSRIGTRIGLENIRRFLPADSHIPERAFIMASAGFSEPAGGWACLRPRPLILFPPESITATGPNPPQQFRWRRMALTLARAIGPERIAPEWWLGDENWRSGLRDYWRIETREGRRLWLFHTPQDPGWFVHGEFA